MYLWMVGGAQVSVGGADLKVVLVGVADLITVWVGVADLMTVLVGGAGSEKTREGRARLRKAFLKLSRQSPPTTFNSSRLT